MSSCAGIHDGRLPQLMQQILGGSSDALGELYGAFAGDVFKVAYRVLKSVPDAEDITGDVFLGMPAALRSYDHGSTCGFVKWLERSTVRSAAAARRVPTIDRLALEQALEGLTPALRTVFLLKAADGWSHREISARLGISVAASKVRLCRARKELRLVLGDGMVGRRQQRQGLPVRQELETPLQPLTTH